MSMRSQDFLLFAVPAAGRPVCASVDPSPSFPAASAADAVPPSAYSFHLAGRTEIPPACGRQRLSLRRRKVHLQEQKSINQ